VTCVRSYAAFHTRLDFSDCKVYVFKHICLQVLFVKNLSNRIKEVDLVSVFGHLDDQGQKRIIYRLMTGRMKGQAFVTFPSMLHVSTLKHDGSYFQGKHGILLYAFF